MKRAGGSPFAVLANVPQCDACTSPAFKAVLGLPVSVRFLAATPGACNVRAEMPGSRLQTQLSLVTVPTPTRAQRVYFEVAGKGMGSEDTGNSLGPAVQPLLADIALWLTLQLLPTPCSWTFAFPGSLAARGGHGIERWPGGCLLGASGKAFVSSDKRERDMATTALLPTLLSVLNGNMMAGARAAT